ncbi:MAG: two-component sensor histidine kinase [Proteobacteria bacterium]|nr:MAG: two-component sensor histidine kinase [Pseudomonadota bacterium]
MAAPSLSTRLLASVSVLLILFFGVTILAIDTVFRVFVDRSVANQLDLQLFALISASEEEGNDLKPAPQRSEPRFANPGSGLYAQIRASDGHSSWRSKSLTGAGLDLGMQLQPGERRYVDLALRDGSRVRAVSLGIEWEFDDGQSRTFTYTVAENLAPYDAQLKRFRGQLFGWFAVLLVLLLAALAMLLRRLLRPLRRVEAEIEAIEAGRLTELGDGYPRELLGVTTNLNALLRAERERLARYRNTLGNLAHSFKTPLAVMRNVLNEPGIRELPVAAQLDEQIERMDGMVRYQLKRAAASGGTGLGTAPVDVKETVEGLRAALLKVYADRNLECELDVARGCAYVGDHDDLTEIAGNLLDNAFKWARSRVRLIAKPLVTPGARREGLRLIVEDDGPGIPVGERANVLDRGTRLDERISGQGIGLSIVRELVQLSGGSMVIGDAALGGARIEVTLPVA